MSNPTSGTVFPLDFTTQCSNGNDRVTADRIGGQLSYDFETLRHFWTATRKGEAK
jgi:hypothetical protein